MEAWDARIFENQIWHIQPQYAVYAIVFLLLYNLAAPPICPWGKSPAAISFYLIDGRHVHGDHISCTHTAATCLQWLGHLTHSPQAEAKFYMPPQASLMWVEHLQNISVCSWQMIYSLGL